MIPRLYLPTPLALGTTLDLDRPMQRYVARVLRLRAGDAVILFNGEGGSFRAEIRRMGPPLQVEIVHHDTTCRESPLTITLVQGVTKQSAMEIIVQKGVELGVNTIQPLVVQRSVSRPRKGRDGPLKRWQRIAVEAAEQCGRDRVPNIAPPCGWEELAQRLPAGPRLLFWEEQTDARPSLSAESI
ncbi:MAG: RsmE family RNA methyltransferase, partial [Magnetococcales bacterium]|nr:RsmE family RNA methyltransferase [Magnetococcales bacterium]